MITLKQVGTSGQITLGKKYAGKTIQMVEDEREGKITLLLGRFIPEHEKWLHEEPMKSKLERAIRYMETHPPKETKLKDLKKINASFTR